MSNQYSLDNSSNIFNLFPQYELDKKEKKQNVFIQNGNEKDIIEVSNKKIGNKKTIASSILTGAVMVVLLAKGIHGSSIKKISSAISQELKEAGVSSRKATIYYAKKGTDRTLNFLQATSNFTAIKDILFDRLFRTNGLTAKFAEGARQFSKRVVDKALSKQYDEVGIHINDMVSMVQQYNIKSIDEMLKKGNPIVTIKGVAKQLSEWREILVKQSKELQNSFDEGFSLGARKSRSDVRDSLLSGTGDKIYEKLFKEGGWRNGENYKTYITEKETREAQEILKNDVIRARKGVTNNIEVIHENIKNDLTDLIHSVNPKDKQTSEIFETVEKNLENFKNCAGENEAEIRKSISEKMIKDIELAINNLKNNQTYSEKEREELIAQAEGIKYQIQSADENSKGALENIMTIIKGLNSETAKIDGKKIITDAEYKQYSELSRKISSGMSEATDKEVGEYFIKHAEMEVGSAATDVFSILFPVGVGAYAVGKCENNDERISATLKTCIPLVGMFGTFVYGTTKMLSGAKNLIFSSVSGFALNKFGAYLDELYQNYKNSGSVVKVAKVEGKNVWSDLSVGLNGKTN